MYEDYLEKYINPYIYKLVRNTTVNTLGDLYIAHTEKKKKNDTHNANPNLRHGATQQAHGCGISKFCVSKMYRNKSRRKKDLSMYCVCGETLEFPTFVRRITSSE